ncbi:hypothetical protein ATCC90586_006343 [Pythium insidiosum]|nr:hypothetical protein ATCC90586_006343 [Pythium insidiosum]
MAAPVSESDAAFYSFCCVMLCLYIVPAVLFTVLRLVQSRSKPSKLLESWTLSLTLVGLALSIAAFWHCMQHLQDVDTTGIFDPYEILQISDGASVREIKKAFRRLGRELHPDKNRHDLQNAHSRFARVTKAYEALTDPVGIENFRKYGHPDGPRSMLLSFAFLSSFSGASGSGSAPLFVLLYFVVIFGVIAAAVYSLHRLAQGALVADEDALRDQRARLGEGQELPRLNITNATMVVADEPNIQPGDWITLEFHVTREHVAAGASAAPASTLWDAVDPRIEFRKEHLWVLVLDRASNRVYAASKLKDLKRDVAGRIVFEGPGVSGRFDMEVRVLCPVYLNIQASAIVPIEVEAKS